MTSPDPILLTGTYQVSPGVAPDTATSWVDLELSAPLHDAAGNVIAAKLPIRVSLSAAGSFQRQVMPNDFPGAAPANTVWRVAATINGVPQPVVSVVVPWDAAGGTFDVSSAPVAALSVSPSAHVATAAELARVQAQVDRVAGAAWQLSEIIAFGHSYGWLTVDYRSQRYLTIVGKQLGIPVSNYAQSSSELLDYGIVQGGWTAIGHALLADLLPTYGAQQVPTPPGLPLVCTGINDLNTNGNDATWDDFIWSWELALRSMMSVCRLGRYYPHDEASTGQTSPTGTWATAVSSAQSLPPGYSYSSAAAASKQVVTHANDAGRVVTLFVLAEKVGASLAADELVVTLDGVEYLPLGHTSRVDTREVLPSTITAGATLPVALRVQLPDDGASHTIVVATANTGGFLYCGWGVETARPQLWCDVARPLDAAYSCDGDGDAKVALMNEVLYRVADEFDYCMVAAIDAALAKDEVNFGDDIHPNPTGHAIMADTVISRIAALGVPSTVRRFL